jgi:hypothetical protein
MRFEAFSFGSTQIDGTTYEHDVVIDRGEVRKREKKPSKKFRDAFGHTPLSIEEKIPWQCRWLVIGTGTGALPVMEQVQRSTGGSLSGSSARRAPSPESSAFDWTSDSPTLGSTGRRAPSQPARSRAASPTGAYRSAPAPPPPRRRW